MQLPQLSYPEAWSLIFFLREGKRQGVRMAPQWEGLIQDYLDNLKSALDELEKENPERKAGENEVNLLLAEKIKDRAWEKTFASWSDKDWEKLEEAWIEFYR